MRVGVVVPILLEGIRIHLLTAAWVACCVPVSMALAMVATVLVVVKAAKALQPKPLYKLMAAHAADARLLSGWVCS